MAASEHSPAELRRTMVVVVFGGVMSLLDATIVNIAIRTLSLRLHTTLPTVQWVVTAYLLALAAMIPVAGWAAARLGAREVYGYSIAAFTLASAACGLAASAGELIAFRVVQGAAGALTMPVGQIILTRAAGRERLARAMAAIGVVNVLAPVFGPVIGGLLVQHSGWRWIFFVNVPVGILAVILTFWLLPRDAVQHPGRPDLLGLALIAGGSAAVTYGLAEAGQAAYRMAIPLAAGILLLAAFAVRSARRPRSMLDVRLYLNRAYSAASVTTFAIGAAIFGGMILMPLYYQVIRHQDPVATGLLAAPTGLGAALAMRASAALTDRIGSGKTSLLGGLLTAIATIPFTVIGPATSYTTLSLSMAVRGFGIGICMMPAMTAAYRAIPQSKISDGTVQLSVLMRLGGSLGTAIFTIVLQHGLNTGAGSGDGASPFAVAFRWALGAAVVALLPAIVLAIAEARPRGTASLAPEPGAARPEALAPAAPRPGGAEDGRDPERQAR